MEANTQNKTNTNTICTNSNNNLIEIDVIGANENTSTNSNHHSHDEVFLNENLIKSELNKLKIGNSQQDSSCANSMSVVAANVIDDSSGSSTSTSSTLPSPNISNVNLKDINSSTVMTATLTDQKCVNEKELNSVSTSTSGLSDYIESSKFSRYMNEVKNFERQFFNGSVANNNLSYNHCNNNIKPSNLINININTLQADIFSNSDFNDFLKKNNDNIYKINNIELKAKQQTNGFNTNSKCSNNNGNVNLNVKKASNSIPIINGNNGKSISSSKHAEKKRNVKRIKDCIDVDGLTKVEDRTFRKLIERDEASKVKIYIEIFLNI